MRDRDLTWGDEHTIQCTDDVLWNCAPETCIILLNSVTPINSIKRKKIIDSKEKGKRKSIFHARLYSLSNANGKVLLSPFYRSEADQRKSLR